MNRFLKSEQGMKKKSLVSFVIVLFTADDDQGKQKRLGMLKPA